MLLTVSLPFSSSFFPLFSVLHAWIAHLTPFWILPVLAWIAHLTPFWILPVLGWNGHFHSNYCTIFHYKAFTIFCKSFTAQKRMLALGEEGANSAWSEELFHSCKPEMHFFLYRWYHTMLIKKSPQSPNHSPSQRSTDLCDMWWQWLPYARLHIEHFLQKSQLLHLP